MGATATGVTADSVKVVVYVPNEQMGPRTGRHRSAENRATGEKASYEDVVHDYVKVYDYAHENLHTFQTWGRTPEFEFVTASGDDEASRHGRRTREEAVHRRRRRQPRCATARCLAAAVAAGKTVVVARRPTPRAARSRARTAGHRIRHELVPRRQLSRPLPQRREGPVGRWRRIMQAPRLRRRAPGPVQHRHVQAAVGEQDQHDEYIDYDDGDREGGRAAPTIISKFKSSGVTTVVLFADAPMTSLMKAATNGGSRRVDDHGFTLHDWDGFGRGADQSQMAPRSAPGSCRQGVRRIGGEQLLQLVLGSEPGRRRRGPGIRHATRLRDAALTAGPRPDRREALGTRRSVAHPTSASRPVPDGEAAYDEHDALGTDRDLSKYQHHRRHRRRSGDAHRQGQTDVPRRREALRVRQVPHQGAQVLRHVHVRRRDPLSSRYANGVVPATSPCTSCPSNGGTGT